MAKTLTFITRATNEWATPWQLRETFEYELSDEEFEILKEAAPEKDRSLQVIEAGYTGEGLDSISELLYDAAEHALNKYYAATHSQRHGDAVLSTVSDVYEIEVYWPREITKPHPRK